MSDQPSQDPSAQTPDGAPPLPEAPALQPSGQAPEAPAQWPAAPPPAYPTVPPGAPVAYAAAYPQAPYQAGPKTSSNAIIALVLSIAAWAVCPIVPAIVSLVFASMASKEIDASGDRIQGRTMVTAARIVSWINIGFYAAVIVVGAFVLVLIAIAGGMDSVKTN